MIPKSQEYHLQTDLLICRAVNCCMDKLNAVYTDELMERTGLSRELITRWLKAHNFKKSAGPTSKRWTRNG